MANMVEAENNSELEGVEELGTLQMKSERVLEFNGELFACFIDWEKAFDRVDWT